MPRFQHYQQQQHKYFTIKQRIRTKFINELNRIRNKYDLTKLVLVLDNISAKNISFLFKHSQLVEYSIVYIEKLEVHRKKLDEHALYMFEPSLENIEFLVKDFQDEVGQYKKVHLLFTSKIEKSLLTKISLCKNLIKKLSRHSIKEFNFQLRLLSQNCVSLNLPYLSTAFSVNQKQDDYKRMRIARRFVDIISSFDSICTIKIYYEQSKNKIGEMMAEQVSKHLKVFIDQLVQSKSKSVNPQAKDITFFISQRSVDIITPLIHSFSYQSLLFDLMDVAYQDDQKIKDKACVNFSELQGQIYEQFRYDHISVGLDLLPSNLEKCRDRAKNLASVNVVEIRKIQDQIGKLQKNLVVMTDIYHKFKQKELKQLGEIELSLATGITEDGKQTKSHQLLSQIIKIIKNSQSKISDQQKLRLALLTICCINLTKQDYETLESSFSDRDRKVIKNFIVFGKSFDSSLGRSTKSIDEQTMVRARKRLQMQNMASLRYTNAVEVMVPNLVKVLKRQIKKDVTGYLGQKVVSILHTQKQNLFSENFDEERLVFFMCGGLSYAEICSLKNCKDLEKIILATDEVTNPSDFLRQLREINIEKK